MLQTVTKTIELDAQFLFINKLSFGAYSFFVIIPKM